MELYVALLPAILVVLLMLGFAAFVLEVPSRIGFLLLNLIALEGFWICLLITEPLSDKTFHFAFAASVYCGLAILLYVLRLWTYMTSKKRLQAPPPVPAREPAAAPACDDRSRQFQELRSPFCPSCKCCNPRSTTMRPCALRS